MAVEWYYFRRLNVSLWQTSHFLGMLGGFHTSSIDASTKRPFFCSPDPLQLQMNSENLLPQSQRREKTFA